MKKMLFIICLCFSFSVQAKLYGEKLSAQNHTPLETIVKSPKEFNGKKLRIKAKIKEVCPMTGCWMMMQTATGEQLRVRVPEGKITFPKSAEGKMALVEGEVVLKQLSRERAIRYYRHMAKDSGKSFDAKSITGPMPLVELMATGAEIH